MKGIVASAEGPGPRLSFTFTDVVHAPAPPVHRDLDTGRPQALGEGEAGELAARIGIEDLRLAVAGQHLLERLDARTGVQGVRQTPGQHIPARPIQDRHQVKKAAPHRDVGDVGAPDMVCPHDRQTLEQIGVDPVLGMRFARAAPPLLTGDFQAQARRYFRLVASARGGLIPCPRWNSSDLRLYSDSAETGAGAHSQQVRPILADVLELVSGVSAGQAAQRQVAPQVADIRYRFAGPNKLVHLIEAGEVVFGLGCQRIFLHGFFGGLSA